MRGKQMIEDLRSRGYQVGDVDETAVEQFLAPAKDYTPAQLAQITARMYAMVERREKAGNVSLATLATAADRLTEMAR